MKKKKILIVGGVILVIAIMILLNVLKSKNEDGSSGFSRGKAQSVTVKTMEKGDLSSSIIITGEVEEVNLKDLVATSSVKISGVLVDVGDKVKNGDTLFTIDVTSVEDDLTQLRLNREIQALQIEKIRSMSTSSSSTGAKIAVELAKLNLVNAQKFYDNQLENVEKNQALFEEGIISSSELESMSKSMEDAKSQIEVASLNLERSESDLSQLYSSNSSSSKSLEYDIQIQLKNLESLDLNIEKAEKQLQEMTDITKANMDGVVTSLLIEVGDQVMAGSPLLQIIDMEHLVIKANVREYDIREMALGQDVVVRGDAISDEVSVLGQISYIAPAASEIVVNGRQTKGVEIKIDITEGMSDLKPGYTVDCEITTHFLKDVLVGSFDLFSEDKDNNKIVFVVVDNVVEERLIETGIVSDFDSEIVSGLVEGDLVVVNPSLALKDGMKVIIEENLDESVDLEKEGE